MRDKRPLCLPYPFVILLGPQQWHCRTPASHRSISVDQDAQHTEQFTKRSLRVKTCKTW